MMKIKLLILCFLSSIIVQSADYYTVITKEHNKYQRSEIESPEPIGTWMPMEDLDFTGKYPSYIDNSSSAQAKYKFNVVSSSWEGDSLGHPSFDENYDDSDLVGCNSIDVEGYCTVSNLRGVYYNKSYETGIYYLEIKISGNPHGDYVGMSKGGKGTMTGMTSGSQLNMRLRKNNVHQGDWHDTDRIGNEDVIQMWINYDEDKILIKKLGVDNSEYNY